MQPFYWKLFNSTGGHKLNFGRMVEVKIVNTSNNDLPNYATEGAAGMDLRAAIAEPLSLEPMQRQLVPTGMSIELPEGYEAQVRPRSGLAIKQGITCLNSPGTIDSDYRGEIKIVLVNLSGELQICKESNCLSSRANWF